MTCKNCYHYDACNAWINHGETLYSDYTYSTEDCPFYKDKSRIVELPCKVGDVIYKIMDIESVHRQILEVEVLSIRIEDKMIFFVKTVKNCLYRYAEYPIDDFGKTVFLTREEAEEALRKERRT